jgi:pimeloyl-ACP methyl ester carboxylesterase
VTTPERVEITGDNGITLVGDRWLAESPVGTVLLMHGGGQTRHSWAKTGERLAARGWTAVNVDTRGHGQSDWDPAGPRAYGMDHLVADLKLVVDWIGEAPVVIGASMGGMTALVSEGENPGLLRAMVLVDVTPRIEPHGVVKITDFMRSGNEGFANLDEVADAIAAYNPLRSRPRNLEGLKKNLRLRPDGRWHWHWDPAFISAEGREPDRGITGDRPREACAGITVPVLLVRGRQSDIVSPEGAQELLDLVPSARLVDVANAGHMVAGDDNDVFTQSVEEFLSQLPELS